MAERAEEHRGETECAEEQNGPDIAVVALDHPRNGQEERADYQANDAFPRLDRLHAQFARGFPPKRFAGVPSLCAPHGAAGALLKKFLMGFAAHTSLLIVKREGDFRGVAKGIHHFR